MTEAERQTKKADLINIIFDTLFNNKQYEQLNTDETSSEEVNANKNEITFDIYGAKFILKLTEATR